MSTLTELKPAGGSGKTVDFVASGALANGSKVILKSDGKVEVVGESTTTYTESIPAGAETSPNELQTIYHSAVFTDTANVFLVAYMDGPTESGRMVVGTVSGTTISFGTEVVFESTSKVHYVSMSFDPNTSGSFVVAYRHYSSTANYGSPKVIAGNISGSTLTFGTSATVQTDAATDISVAFDPNTAGKFVVAYDHEGSVDEGRATLGTISGTTITIGTTTAYESSVGAQYTTLSFDPNTAGKFVVYYRSTSEYGRLRVGTISGASISFGTANIFNSYGTFNGDLAFVTGTANKFIVAYKNEGNSYHVSSALGTVSGTSVSIGSSVTARSENANEIKVNFDPNSSSRFIVTTALSGTSVVVGTLSGSTITYGSQNAIDSLEGAGITTAFDANSPGKFITVWTDNPDGEACVSQLSASEITTNLTATNFLGTSTEAYADTATATILMQGGISTNQTGLTIGSDYYVQADGTLSTTADSPSVKLGKALSTTTALLSGE
jgi:hypothetical protein